MSCQQVSYPGLRLLFRRTFRGRHWPPVHASSDGGAVARLSAQAICTSEVTRLLKLPPGEGKPKFEALSAGLSVSASSPISAKAVSALRDLGCEPQPHVSREVTQELVERADAIYCMTDQQCRDLALRFPAATWKLQRLDPVGNVEDSPSSDPTAFLRVATRIRDLVRWRLESQFRFPLAE